MGRSGRLGNSIVGKLMLIDGIGMDRLGRLGSVGRSGNSGSDGSSIVGRLMLILGIGMLNVGRVRLTFGMSGNSGRLGNSIVGRLILIDGIGIERLGRDGSLHLLMLSSPQSRVQRQPMGLLADQTDQPLSDVCGS